MSVFKVSKENIKLFEHPKADLLQIGKVGRYQVVVEKNLYKDGDVVVFAPEKSLLTGRIRDEFEKYLAGTNKDRVHSIRLRGQLSCGIIIPPSILPDLSHVPVGEDIAELLGITMYVPEIPKELLGAAEPSTVNDYVKHDVEQYLVYEENFVPGERVVATEKVHGVQISVVLERTDEDRFNVMSKGLASSLMMFSLTEENLRDNTHVRVVHEIGLRAQMEKLRDSLKAEKLQVVGEIIPSQKGYRYGFDRPTMRIFSVIVTFGVDEPVSMQYDQVPDYFSKLWVPVLYDGPFSRAAVNLAKGKEQVSGKAVHIREGVVVCPYVARRASDGTRLLVKIINPDYKETGEELS